MTAFMNEDFLLSTPTAGRLFREVARDCPIIDYHCHLSPEEIWADVRYDNITQVWLGGDHYKWRLMRCAGVEERFITGDADDRDKFLKWAEVLGKAIGNPLYHWSHLELQRYFGWHGALSAKTAGEVWDLTREKLRGEDFSARGLIRRSNVETLCTTDDPVDSLEFHEKLAADASFPTAVLPAWRPDAAMGIEQEGWRGYIDRLSAVSGVEIASFSALKAALSRRMDFFARHGCVLSDHGMSRVAYAPAEEEDVERIMARRLAGERVTAHEADVFRFAFMAWAAGEYTRRGWAMQLHYSVRRDNSGAMFARLGPNTGYDCIDDCASAGETAAFLDALERAGNLPRTILYSLNPNDNQAIDSICGCFQTAETVSKIQHGSAWWFNDHFDGMTDQLKSLASLGYLAGFVGMLTDSRSVLSYPRDEYFRRILCRLLGEWVEDGRYPDDFGLLSEIVRGVSYENAKRYFGFGTKSANP